MVRIITTLNIVIFLSILNSCNGQNPDIANFQIAEPIPNASGQWLTFSKKIDFTKLAQPYGKDAELLLVAKAALLKVLNQETLPVTYTSASELKPLATTVINYRLAYGVKLDSDSNTKYILRWERTGPVLPKSVSLEIKNNKSDWVVTNQVSGNYFWYIDQTWSRHHKRIFSPSSKTKEKTLTTIVSSCKISHATRFILDADCFITNLRGLSEKDRITVYESLK